MNPSRRAPLSGGSRGITLSGVSSKRSSRSFVTTLTFFVVRLMPGSPVDAYIAKQVGEFGVSYIDAAAQAESLFAINPSKPLYQQYFTYLGRLVQGNLGKSLVSS